MNTDTHGLNAEETEIIRHSLGLNYKRKPYRNYYCVAECDPKLESLVEKGLMKRGGTTNDGRDRYYYVTAAGAAAVGSELPNK